MDIANYISELLGRHGHLSVPGLGHFTMVRVNGYYNNAEGTFYPPGNEVQFNPEPLDDDILVQHIAEDKKISLASSKYFIEKYITNLKHDISLKEVRFANLGRFYTEHGQIAFKPGESRNSNAEFYGFAPVSLKKPHQEPELPVVPAAPFSNPEPVPAEVIEQPEVDDVIEEEQDVSLPVTSSTNSESVEMIEHSEVNDVTKEEQDVLPPVTLSSTPEPVEIAEQPEVNDVNEEEPEETRSSSKTWLIVLIIIVVLAAAAFGVYKYNPGLFQGADKPAAAPSQPKKEPAAKVDSAADTGKTTIPVQDTSAKAISKPDTALNKPLAQAASNEAGAAKPPTAETKPEYVIFAGSFKTQSKSNMAVRIYKSVGVDARTWNGPGAGKRIKIIIGSFATSAEAETERLKLVKAKKISKDSYSQEINEKK